MVDATKSFKDAILEEQSVRIRDLGFRLLQAKSDCLNKVDLSVVRGREIARLNSIIHDKNVLIKNLISERGKLARELSAEKVVHDIDLQATESAESALQYKEKEYAKSLREKDEVIDELSKELAHSKEREDELLATIKDYLNEIKELKNKIKFKKSDVGCRNENHQVRFSFPKEGRLFFFSSRCKHNNILGELSKLFLEY